MRRECSVRRALHSSSSAWQTVAYISELSASPITVSGLSKINFNSPPIQSQDALVDQRPFSEASSACIEAIHSKQNECDFRVVGGSAH
jgi:hypothetical protein